MKTRLITAASALALVVALPGVAAAQIDTATTDGTDRVRVTDQAQDRAVDTATIDGIKERALAAIERRLETLDRLEEKVSENVHVTAEHAAALLDDYKEATRGLSELAEEIEEAETPEELRKLIPAIAEEYRVYLVIAPKSFEVVASDTIVDVAVRAVEVADKLDELIARAIEAGWDPELLAKASEAVDQMRRDLADAEATGGPVAGSVIDLMAADWPDPAKALLEQGRRDLTSARESVRSAHAGAKEAAALIRQAKPGDVATDVAPSDVATDA